MNTPEVILLITFAACTVVGLAVLLANSRRAVNQAFFLLSLVVAGWLGSILEVFTSHADSRAALWIRITSIVGAFAPLAISMLRVSIVYPALSFFGTMRRMPWWLLAYGVVSIYCLTPLYLVGAQIPPAGIPNAQYGSLSDVYPVYMLGSFASMLILLIRAKRTARGATRAELEYVLAGVWCFFGAGIFTCVIPLVVHNSQVVGLAPLWFVAMDLVIAYGIATRSILSVSALMRRALSYLLLITYLTGIYAGVYYIISWLLGRTSLHWEFLPALVGAICVALSVGGAQSFLQAFVRKLFINIHQLDLRSTLTSADRLLTQVTTTGELLSRFVPLLSRAAGTDSVSVCLFGPQELQRVWSSDESAAAKIENVSMSTLEVFGTLPSPIMRSSISREVEERWKVAGECIRAISGTLVACIKNGQTLIGIIVLGEKLSGRIYDREEQEAIQILSNRLGVALENARLYTEQQKNKEYLQSLLGELTIGVLACDQNELISVCNEEAERILGGVSSSIIGTSMTNLPEPFPSAFREVLSTGVGERDRSSTIKLDAKSIPIRYSAQIFADRSQGAFLVFSDLTTIKGLEEQLRRSDRLAILGTLSAGLAHEIRNPLAPIRTFVELIPERAGDPEFVQRFMQIVSTQVSRIETLITQLLSFSKSGVAHREDISCHKALQDILALLSHDLRKRGVEIETDFRASRDHIHVDRRQFDQVILNTLLNAADAMSSGGKVTIATIEVGDFFELKITDSGPGIPKEVLPHIFDPFVTTKETGTGLGLSIAYGIIIEHGGTIEIMNAQEGAVIQIRLPIYESRKLAA